VEAWTADQALRTGLIAHPAKMSVELRPPVEADKGRVVTELAAGLDAVCFVGDDRGDLPAFAALADLAAEGVQTLAVAVSSEEAPPELLAAADLVVAGPEGALALLRALV
jgi:trehalose 6-phosphate phosphatase